MKKMLYFFLIITYSNVLHVILELLRGSNLSARPNSLYFTFAVPTIISLLLYLYPVRKLQTIEKKQVGCSLGIIHFIFYTCVVGFNFNFDFLLVCLGVIIYIKAFDVFEILVSFRQG